MVQPGRSLSRNVGKNFCIQKLQIEMEKGTLATRRLINVLVCEAEQTPIRMPHCLRLNVMSNGRMSR